MRIPPANGMNKTSGDRIVMQFADGKAETIRVYGGVEGQYFPEPMVRRQGGGVPVAGLPPSR